MSAVVRDPPSRHTGVQAVECDAPDCWLIGYDGFVWLRQGRAFVWLPPGDQMTPDLVATSALLAAPSWQALAAPQGRTYIASLRALHLNLRLVASDQAAVEERHIPGRQLHRVPGMGPSEDRSSDMSNSLWGRFKASGGVQPEGVTTS